MTPLLVFIWIVCCLYTACFSKKNGLDILIMGDFGGTDQKPYTTQEEVSSAHYMGQIASKYSADMVWATGDNIYEDGATSEYDTRFQETFEDVFTQSSLNIPFYMIAGNHDHYGNITAQIYYSNHSERWMYPDVYYTQTWDLPNSKRTVELVMIDTILTCGQNYDTEDDCQARDIPKQQCYIDEPGFDTHDKDQYKEQLSLSQDQWEWIEAHLKASKADYLFVAGHYPVWNVGKHQNTECLVETLRPLLIQYNVTMYINGHSHTMEYIVEDEFPNLPYITSGATHGCDDVTYNDTVPAQWVKFHGCQDGGFNRLRINETGAFVEYYYGNSSKVQFVGDVIPPRL
eukprot:515060_1